MANYTIGINKKINTNLVEFAPIDTMKELQDVLSKNYGYDLAEGSHFQDYTIKDPKTGKWTIYLIREELPRYQALDTAAWHGASGHVGVELLMGKEADNFFDRVFSKFMKDNPRELSIIANAYKMSPETLAGRRKIAREAFAFFSEKNPRNSLVKEFIAMFRRWLRVVFPSISLSDEEIINVAMKSRELITSHLDATTVNAPYIYRNYSKSFAKPTSEIVISRSFQGADKSALIGPNDVQYVARDQVSGDSGRIIITSMDNGFVLKQLEVDPGYMGFGVIDKLILNAVMEHGPLRDITKITGKEKASLGMTLQKYPEIFGDTKVSMATRGFPRSIDAESPPGAEITMPLLNYTQHDRGPGNVWVKQSPGPPIRIGLC